MMPDNFFKTFVLSPCMQAFGQEAVLNPCISDPAATPYNIRGVFTNRPQKIALQDGGFISANVKMLGINLADFPIQPRQDDQIIFGGVTYDITDYEIDGQGGCNLMLREATAR